jgi:hypothetical protein
MAYNFNGTTQSISAIAPVTNLPLTLAAWFRLTTVPRSALQVIVQLNNFSFGSTSNSYRMVVPANSTFLRALHNSTAGLGTADTPPGSVIANNFYHGAAVFNSTSSRSIYLNGTTTSTNTTVAGALNITNINIGANFTNTATAGWLEGIIAEVGAWNVALTQSEIISLAKGVTCNKIRPQNLVFYAPLVRDLIDTKGGLILTANNGPTVTAHPRVYA